MTIYIIILAWFALQTNEVVIIWVGMLIYVYKKSFLQLLNVNDLNPCNHFAPIHLDNGELNTQLQNNQNIKSS
jgi:hypothetical protein